MLHLLFLVEAVLGAGNDKIIISNYQSVNSQLSVINATSCTNQVGVQAQYPVLQALFGNNIVAPVPVLDLPIRLASPDPTGCAPQDFTCPLGCYVLILRGGCSFVEKANNTRAASNNVSAVFIYDNAPATALTHMSGEDTRYSPLPGVPAFSMFYSDGSAIAQALQQGIQVYGSMSTTGAIYQAEWDALRSIAATMVVGACDNRPPLFCTDCDLIACGFGDTRPWTELMVGNSNYNVDPCLYRIVGVQCRAGHVVALKFRMPLLGALPRGISNLTYLEYLSFDQAGLVNDIGCVFEGLNNLQTLLLTSNNVSTWPACNCKLPALTILQLDVNTLTTLPPEFANMTNLQTLTIESNTLTSLPAELGLLPNLKYLDVSYNYDLVDLPELGGLPKLTSLIASAIGMTSLSTGTLGVNSLRELWVPLNRLTSLDFTHVLSNLTVLIAQDNQITSFPPLINLMTSLRTLDLSLNNISGPTPSFNGFTSLFQLLLNDNNISGPLPALSNSSLLANILLYNNQFTGHIPDTWGALSSLTTLLAQSNQITSPVWTLRSLPLITVDLSHNKIALPSGLPNSGATDAGALVFGSFGGTLQSINFAYNFITGFIDTAWSGPLRNISVVNLTHNAIQKSQAIHSIPSLAVYDMSHNSLTYVDEYFPTSKNLRFLSYRDNPDLKMRSAVLPAWLVPQELPELYPNRSLLCSPLGLNPAIVTASFQVLFDPEFTSNQYCDCIPGTYGTPPECQVIPDFFEVINWTVSDTDFGHHRQVSGVDIVFGSPTNGSSKVRVNEIRLAFGPDFIDFTDLLEVFSGDQTLKGQRVLSIRGGDSITDGQLHQFDNGGVYSITTHLPPQNISGFDWLTVQVSIFAEQASIHFQSRAESGQHFRADFSQRSECPDGYLPDDKTSVTCKRTTQPFVVSAVSQGILYFLVAVGCVAIIATLAVFTKFQKTRVVRAASFLFSILTLCSLLVFLCGSLLYSNTPNSVILCHARPWLTFLPLVLVLSFFITKMDRVRTIFTSVKLKTNLGHLKAGKLLKICALMSGIMVVLLIVYSVAPLTTLVKTETHRTDDDGTRIDLLETHCAISGDALFSVWCTIMAFYIFGILGWGLYVGWAIRNTPSAFNESARLFQCFVGITILGALCALFLLVLPQDGNVVIVVWGFGQALAAWFIYGNFFIPKLVALAKGPGKQDPNTTNNSALSASSTSRMKIPAIDSTGNVKEDLQQPPRTEMEILEERLDAAEKALKAQRAQFERMFREWGWTGELNEL